MTSRRTSLQPVWVSLTPSEKSVPTIDEKPNDTSLRNGEDADSERSCFLLAKTMS